MDEVGLGGVRRQPPVKYFGETLAQHAKAGIVVD
jgi:hypothetical protein